MRKQMIIKQIKNYLGKKIAGIKNNEKVFIKQEHFDNEKLEKDKPCNKMESLNEELCQLLQQKSKFSILGPISWKTFLLPEIKRLNSNPKKGKKYFGLDLIEDRAQKLSGHIKLVS